MKTLNNMTNMKRITPIYILKITTNNKSKLYTFGAKIHLVKKIHEHLKKKYIDYKPNWFYNYQYYVNKGITDIENKKEKFQIENTRITITKTILNKYKTQ